MTTENGKHGKINKNTVIPNHLFEVNPWHFVNRQLVKLKLCLINNFVDYDSLSTYKISQIIFLDFLSKTVQNSSKSASVCVGIMRRMMFACYHLYAKTQLLQKRLTTQQTYADISSHILHVLWRHVHVWIFQKMFLGQYISQLTLLVVNTQSLNVFSTSCRIWNTCIHFSTIILNTCI